MKEALERVKHYFLERYGHQSPLMRMDDNTAEVYKKVCMALGDDVPYNPTDFLGRPIAPKAL